MIPLTRRQAECLTFIRTYSEREGVPPTYDEIKTAMGLSSKSGIHRLIQGLKTRGVIRLLPKYTRSIQIIEHQSYQDILGPSLTKALEQACSEMNIKPQTGLRTIVSNWLGVG